MCGVGKRRSFGWVAALAVLAAATTAVAAPPGGENLAERVCAQCHAVKPGQVSKNPDAPPFAELASQPSITEFSLRVFLRTPHENMPNFMLKPDEMDEITSYILSLKRTP
jgi:mono/diheme cytochrome c family protein